MLYFKLDNIKTDQDLMNIISKIKHSLGKMQDSSNKLLVVKIQDVTGDDSSMIPKLEYKKE